MSKKILFVVEGSKTENKCAVNIFKRVMKVNDENVAVHRHSTNVYDLYDKLFSGEYDYFIDYLRVNAKKLFKGATKPSDYFSSIYLVFDLDPQDPRFSVQKCEKLLNYFNDDTNNGKLYFNYPMVETIFDISSLNQKQFNGRVVNRLGLSSESYKSRVNKISIIKNRKGYSLRNKNILYQVIQLNINKYFYLVNSDRDDSYSNQMELLNSEKIFLSKNKISVVNSSLLILHDYNDTMIETLIK